MGFWIQKGIGLNLLLLKWSFGPNKELPWRQSESLAAFRVCLFCCRHRPIYHLCSLWNLPHSWRRQIYLHVDLVACPNFYWPVRSVIKCLLKPGSVYHIAIKCSIKPHWLIKLIVFIVYEQTSHSKYSISFGLQESVIYYHSYMIIFHCLRFTIFISKNYSYIQIHNFVQCQCLSGRIKILME